MWELQDEFEDDGYEEEEVHHLLERRAPEYGSLLQAIRAYEAFARRLQDAFDILRSESARRDAQGYPVPEVARDEEFCQSVNGLHDRFTAAHHALADISLVGAALPHLFVERFGRFEVPMDAAACALVLCEHHEIVQRGKSAEGKRPWFDRIGRERIYMRHTYRVARREIQPDRYVHEYRSHPIRRFHKDLS
ncbi:hypothetical protein HS125_05580 [bacterium]|nr:hypothetical protein [bacterium]